MLLGMLQKTLEVSVPMWERIMYIISHSVDFVLINLLGTIDSLKKKLAGSQIDFPRRSIRTESDLISISEFRNTMDHHSWTVDNIIIMRSHQMLFSQVYFI